MEKFKMPLANLQRFEWWLQVHGYEIRPPRGMWQVLQVNFEGKEWACLFSRKKGIAQLTVDPRLVPLVLRFDIDLADGLVPIFENLAATLTNRGKHEQAENRSRAILVE